MWLNSGADSRCACCPCASHSNCRVAALPRHSLGTPICESTSACALSSAAVRAGGRQLACPGRSRRTPAADGIQHRPPPHSQEAAMADNCGRLLLLRDVYRHNQPPPGDGGQRSKRRGPATEPSGKGRAASAQAPAAPGDRWGCQRPRAPCPDCGAASCAPASSPARRTVPPGLPECAAPR